MSTNVRPVKARIAPSASSDPPGASTGNDTAKRTQILDGAWRAFRELGLDGTSVDQLAAAAGVSKPTLYKYFDSKETIFLTLVTEQVEVVRGTRFQLDASMGEPAALLEELGVSFVSALMQQRTLDLCRMLISEAPRFPALGRAFEKAGPMQGQAALTAYLGQLDALGALRVDDPKLASQQFMALCEIGLMRKAHTLAERPTRARIVAIVRAAVRVFLKGYAAD